MSQDTKHIDDGGPAFPQLNLRISDIRDLSVRSRNALRRLGIIALGDVVRLSEKDLRNAKNVGEYTVQEVKRFVAQHGLHLKQDGVLSQGIGCTSLRDYFAAKAMQAIATNSTTDGEPADDYSWMIRVAHCAYGFADAMLAARKAGAEA